MFLFAHLVVALIIGKLGGSYLWALIGTFFADIDHFISYARHGVLFKPKLLWKAVTSESDPWGDQRNILHNLFIWALISCIFLFIDLRIGIIFSLGYLSNLALDSMDKSDYYPFYPSKKIVIRGPIGYLSREEIVFTLMMLVLFLLL